MIPFIITMTIASSLILLGGIMNIMHPTSNTPDHTGIITIFSLVMVIWGCTLIFNN